MISLKEITQPKKAGNKQRGKYRQPHKKHHKRHDKPIVFLTRRRAFKAFQYSYGYFCYRGRKKDFQIMPFNRKSFKK